MYAYIMTAKKVAIIIKKFHQWGGSHKTKFHALLKTFSTETLLHLDKIQVDDKPSVFYPRTVYIANAKHTSLPNTTVLGFISIFPISLSKQLCKNIDTHSVRELFCSCQ